jgi:hypothetical protein
MAVARSLRPGAGGILRPLRGGMKFIMDLRIPDLKAGAIFPSVPPGRAGSRGVAELVKVWLRGPKSNDFGYFLLRPAKV